MLTVFVLKMVKPCLVGALVGLVTVHWLSGLSAAACGVATLWALSMLFV